MLRLWLYPGVENKKLADRLVCAATCNIATKITVNPRRPAVTSAAILPSLFHNVLDMAMAMIPAVVPKKSKVIATA